MIILEGADGSGKSTLAAKLSEKIGWPLVHSGGPLKSYQETQERLKKLYAKGPQVIFDRFPVISDPIYAKAFRKKTYVTRNGLVTLLNRQLFIIYCDAPNKNLPPQNNSEVDTVEHVANVKLAHTQLKKSYFNFFSTITPDVIYRWKNEAAVIALAECHAFEVNKSVALTEVRR